MFCSHGYLKPATTGYWNPSAFVQHWLPGAAHTLPQQELNCPHTKLCNPLLFSQQTPSLPKHTSPQHVESALQ